MENQNQRFEQIWSVLELAIREIQVKCKTKNLSYVELYRSAYDLVVSQRSNWMYANIRNLITQHLTDNVKQRVLRDLENDFLASLNKEWVDHQLSMVMIRDIVMYLDKVYVQQHDLDNVYNLGITIFKDQVVSFAPIKEKLRVSVLQMIAKERAGEVINRGAIKNALDMLVGLGISSTTYYEQNFETSFLADSAEFYQLQYAKYMSECSVTLYIKMVHKMIQDEKERSKHYLNSITGPKVLELAEKELVQKHMAEIVEMGPGQVRQMIRQAQTEELKEICTLLSKHEGGTEILYKECLGTLREQFIAIYQEEQASAQAAGPSNVNQSTVAAINIVKNLLDLFDNFKKISNEVFEDSASYEAKFSNEFKLLLKNKSSISENLSLYIDSFLKKGERDVSDEDLNTKMDRVMCIFKCLKEIDSFEEYYRKHLSARLIDDKTIGDDYERSMVSRFKEQCGWQATKQIEEMFKDIQLSEDCYEEFRAHQNNENSLIPRTKVDLHVKILREEKWAVLPVLGNLTIPQMALSAFESFQLFYMNKYKNKKIWLHCRYGNADLKVTFFNANNKPARTNVVNVPTLFMVILLLFNDRIALTFTEIQCSTNIPVEHLKRCLQLLTSGPLRIRLLRKAPEIKEIKPDNSFTVNEDYKPKHHKVKINFLETARETSQQKKETDSVIETRRGFEISAAIVRVMKARQKMKHNSLVAEVIDQLNHRFAPDPVKIKRSIEILIEREYIEREQGQMDTYLYR